MAPRADLFRVIDLDELAQAASQLEPLPVSSTRLAALVCAGTPELGQVVEIVQFDEALTASLLRSANSSWSASRSEITTVRDAVIRLGASPVLALTLGLNVRRRLDPCIPEYGLSEGALWRHSVCASLAAELLTVRAAHRPPPETATAALLHDVGKLVMARFLDRSLLDAMREHQERGATQIDAEAAVLGIDHAELGGLIARSWALPESLVRGIGEHGRPDPGADPLVHAVYLSDVLAKTIVAAADSPAGDGPAGEGPADMGPADMGPAEMEAYFVGPEACFFNSAMDALGLGPADFDVLRALVAERLEEVEHRFN